jgi:MoaA/NifB/PqqE/SkfB family radical SAM enzyme
MSSQSVGGNGNGPLAPENGHREPEKAPAIPGRALYSTLAWAGPRLARIGPLRRAAMGIAERRLDSWYESALDAGLRPPGVDSDRHAVGKAILHTLDRAIAEDRLCQSSFDKALSILIRGIIVNQGDWNAKGQFAAQYGYNPPDLLLISPTKTCNLRCIGCYADSGPTREKLTWQVFDRLLGEAHDLWGLRFFVISGGEPLSYRDEGKTLLDAVAKYSDCFFMMYTNGTLIDDRMAARIAELGNLMPAISLEGMKARTDQRRGDGVFDQIVAAMTRLRREKALFGASLTATRLNAEEVLSEEVVNFLFEEMGVLFAWLFHYMPIGRAYTLDLLPTPEQRLMLWTRTWELVRKRNYFIADFWDSGTASDGCISAGREGGYMAVDWNGSVMPCVFAPYSPVNLNAAYEQGRTLNDVWAEPFFAHLRSWQREYGYKRTLAQEGEHRNWILPCPIRDHHAEFRRIVLEDEPEPVDENAAQALLDPGYREGLEVYDRALAEIFDPLWAAEYMVRGARDRKFGT